MAASDDKGSKCLPGTPQAVGDDSQVHCPHKESGCEWVGGVNGLKSHLESCLLEPVACEYAEVGCDVKVPRRDLACHMEEGQQQHLLSATLFNLRLTRENTEEKNRLLQEKDAKIEQLQKQLDGARIESEQKIVEKSRELSERDEKIAELQKQLKQMQEVLEDKITGLQQQVKDNQEDNQKRLEHHHVHIERLLFCQLKGYTLLECSFTGFSNYEEMPGYGDWFSEPFYSHPGGCKFRCHVIPRGVDTASRTHISVCFQSLPGDYDEVVAWPVTTTAHVQLLNQLGDHKPRVVTLTETWKKNMIGYFHSGIEKFIKHTDLGLNAEQNTQYMKDDCLHFRIYFKAEPSEKVA